MYVDDKSKISKTAEVITKLEGYDINSECRDILLCKLKAMKKYVLHDSSEIYYDLGATIPIAVLSLAGALEDDPFDYFVDMVEKHHGNLDGKRIIEVGAGICPIVSERLLKRNPNIKSIDVYDPKLISGYPVDPKIKLHPTKFDSSVDIGDCDIIVAMQPCGCTFDLLDIIEKNKFDSTVMLCTCDDSRMYKNFYNDEIVSYTWHRNIRDRVESMSSHSFETGYGNTRYEDTIYENTITVPYFYTKLHYVDDSIDNPELISRKKYSNT